MGVSTTKLNSALSTGYQQAIKTNYILLSFSTWSTFDHVIGPFMMRFGDGPKERKVVNSFSTGELWGDLNLFLFAQKK